MLDSLRAGSKRIKTIWWVLTIFTVASFIGGFIFMAGVGFDSGSAARMSGALGSVNGERITQDMWREARAMAELNFRQQYQTNPVDRDMKMVEQQAWRNLVAEHLMSQQAKRAGLKVGDAEVLWAIRNQPPNALLMAPVFQTNGQFDPQKYQAALSDPNNNWAPFEDMVRQQLPVRKLQERLLSSIKLSEPELREAFHDRFDRINAVLLQVPPADTGSVKGTDAELKAVYDRYKNRLASTSRTQLEVLTAPKRLTDEEIRAATETGKEIVRKARAGEDFFQLAKNFSEGPNADKGGVIDRFMSPSELGPVLGPMAAAHKPGDILDAYQEGSRVLVIKLLDPARDSVARNPPYPGALKLAQIQLRIRQNPTAMQEQYAELKKLADRAKSIGLGKAATEKGLVTQKTAMFDYSNSPPQLFATPEAADWGMLQKVGAVSPVFQGSDEFTIVQVLAQHVAGPPSMDEMKDQLKQIADFERRVELSKPRADAVAASIKSGQSLEDAAKAAGLAATPMSLSRVQPDPRLAGAPEIQGALWGAKPGQVIGPLRAPTGWYFARLESVAAAPDSMYNEQMKGQLTNEILQRRQRAFFDGYLVKLRGEAKIQDLRAELGID